jgi:hypothetical protein
MTTQLEIDRSGNGRVVRLLVDGVVSDAWPMHLEPEPTPVMARALVDALEAGQPNLVAKLDETVRLLREIKHRDEVAIVERFHEWLNTKGYLMAQLNKGVIVECPVPVETLVAMWRAEVPS